MDQNKLQCALKQGSIEWSAHALKTMIERDISRKVVLQVIGFGEIIEEYSQDNPFPSVLIL